MKDEKITEDTLRRALSGYMNIKGQEILDKEHYDVNDGFAYPDEEQVKEKKKICNREFKKIWLRNGIKAFPYKVVTAVAVILILINISIVTVPGLREIILNFKMSSSATNTKIVSDDSKGSIYNEENSEYSIGTDNTYEISYIPEGFTLTKSQSTTRIKDYEYSCGDKSFIFSQMSEDSTLQVDTEGAKVEYVDINGNKALVSEEDNYIVITWKEDEYFFELSANEIDKDTVIKIAKSTKKCN